MNNMQPKRHGSSLGHWVLHVNHDKNLRCGEDDIQTRAGSSGPASLWASAVCDIENTTSNPAFSLVPKVPNSQSPFRSQ